MNTKKILSILFLTCFISIAQASMVKRLFAYSLWNKIDQSAFVLGARTALANALDSLNSRSSFIQKHCGWVKKLSTEFRFLAYDKNIGHSENTEPNALNEELLSQLLNAENAGNDFGGDYLLINNDNDGTVTVECELSGDQRDEQKKDPVNGSDFFVDQLMSTEGDTDFEDCNDSIEDDFNTLGDDFNTSLGLDGSFDDEGDI